MDNASRKACLDALVNLSLAAGKEILALYGADVAVEAKDDHSPVTAADRLGEEIILKGLAAAFPETPVLAEEAASAGQIPALGDAFFLVDPLDGTKEFINKTGEFTVNIALIESGRPVLGVVYAPAIGRLYTGIAGGGARRLSIDVHGDVAANSPIAARAPSAGGLIAVASRSHRSPETDAFLKTLPISDFAAAGSSLKFCLIAEAAADVYPRLGRTMEWDTGAGQAVLEAAGGRVVAFDASADKAPTRDAPPLRYGKTERGYDNPFFIAWGAEEIATEDGDA